MVSTLGKTQAFRTSDNHSLVAQPERGTFPNGSNFLAQIAPEIFNLKGKGFQIFCIYRSVASFTISVEY